MEHVEGGVTAAPGFKAAGIHAGIKYKRLDLALIFSEGPAAAAGCFTTNRVKAAPVLFNQEAVARGSARAIIINSGNANACTGEAGMRDAREMAALTAAELGLEPDDIMVGSTGVIGTPLPMDALRSGIPQVAAKLSSDGGLQAAEAIMTTDSAPKTAAVVVDAGGTTFTVGGMAKGSGMIHPNMATMLAYITTDLAVPQAELGGRLKAAVDKTFNMISVDGDSSTNDSVVLLAGGGQPVPFTDELREPFAQALHAVCRRLAKGIARDGEGAQHLLEVIVEGAPTEADARKAARAVTCSNLVKTAVTGNDPNWGRIICAIGYSGAIFDPGDVDLWLGDVQVMAGGAPAQYEEADAAAAMTQETVVVRAVLGSGEGEAVAWGCDLTKEYVSINADYRT